MADDQHTVVPAANAEPLAQEVAPSNGVPKRQRRPNVRLNEIGDRPLSSVLEFLLKRKGGRVINGKAVGASSKSQYSSVKREPAFGLKDEAGGKVDGRGEVALPRAPRTRPLNHLERSSHAKNGTAPLNCKPWFTGASASPRKGEGLMRNRLLSRKGKLGKRRHSGHGIMVSAKRPGNARVRAYEEGSWRVAENKVIVDGPSGNLEEGARDWEFRYGLPDSHSDDDAIEVLRGNTHLELQEDFEMNHDESSDPEDRDVTQENQVARKLASDSSPKDGDGRDLEKEPSKSDKVQELHLQVPLWERGIPPLENKVRDWLQSIGLEKYGFLFQLHEVGSDVLPLLTMDDLREIGVTAVGARRKLFNEIKKFRQGLIHVDGSFLADK